MRAGVTYEDRNFTLGTEKSLHRAVVEASFDPKGLSVQEFGGSGIASYRPAI